jgi:hypothetical protein
MTDKEIMQQALDALGTACRFALLEDRNFPFVQGEEAITALKARLEQPEDEPVSLKPCRSPYCECDSGKCTHPGFYDARDKPQPAAWIGLTDEEIRNWWRIENGLEDCDMAKLVDFTLVVRSVEVALKEKNHG